MFHRILVGVDDSPAAKAALERAVELVEASHGRLGLLSSAPGPPPLPCAGPVVLPVSRAQLEQQLLDWAQRNVEEAAKLVPEEIPVTKLVSRGSPGRALLREARSGCWDLVIVGQSHRRRMPLLERVGERLNRRSATPVLVVHEEPREPRRVRGRHRRRRAQVRAV
ncbi:MAG: universal stress protein [Thermoleophilaceae bacterium]|nr:universal stress protein [Thermoleophilaceae bacterium]